MRRIGTLMFLIGMGIYLNACAGKDDPERIKSRAKALDDKFITALAAGDLRGVMECYWNSMDVISYPPDMLETKGYENVMGSYEKFLTENHIKDARLINTSYMAVGDYGLSWGTWVVTIDTPNGQETKIEGRQTSLSGMRDGKWVYIIDHASQPLPQATPMPVQKIQKPGKKAVRKPGLKK